MSQPSTDRIDVSFAAGDGTIAAWFYPAAGAASAAPGPAVVLAHVLGAVKEMGLDAFARRFVAAGYACLVFDYRHFGGSSGQPRQLLDIESQVADWHAALAYVRSEARPEVDPDRVAVWGTSFGGGHAIRIAAEDPRVAAAIAQCPFTDGFASARTGGLRSTLKVSWRATLDLLARLLRRPPVMVASAGPPGEAALMTAPDAAPGYLGLTQDAPTFRNEVAARFALAISLYRPGRLARRVQAPLYVAVCTEDSVAPAGATRRHVSRAARVEAVDHPCGHFDIYVGDDFEHAVTAYVDFLGRHLPVA